MEKSFQIQMCSCISSVVLWPWVPEQLPHFYFLATRLAASDTDIAQNFQAKLNYYVTTTKNEQWLQWLQKMNQV